MCMYRGMEMNRGENANGNTCTMYMFVPVHVRSRYRYGKYLASRNPEGGGCGSRAGGAAADTSVVAPAVGCEAPCAG